MSYVILRSLKERGKKQRRRFNMSMQCPTLSKGDEIRKQNNDVTCKNCRSFSYGCDLNKKNRPYKATCTHFEWD